MCNLIQKTIYYIPQIDAILLTNALFTSIF